MSENNLKEDEKPVDSVKNEAKKEEPVAKVVTLTHEEHKKLLEDARKGKEEQERLLRVQADFENSRKRMERQTQEFAKYATEKIILELLNILDDLERTVQAAETKHADPQAFLKGMEMILSHLYELLKEHGVIPVGAEGKLYDPHTSEALMQADSDLPEGTVIEEMQKGYFLNDRVVRTAKVKVAKNSK